MPWKTGGRSVFSSRAHLSVQVHSIRVILHTFFIIFISNILKSDRFRNPGVGDFISRNYRRVAEVWMDEYKEHLYKRRPALKTADAGINILNKI
jgi:hypothetical protein